LGRGTLATVAHRILIVEDDARYRDSLRTLVERSAALEVVGAFRDPRAALDWMAGVERAPFDIALMDLDLPILSGIETTRRIKARFPEVAVIVLTVFEEPRAILDAICAGADGYLLKKTPARELVALIQSIEGGAPLTAGVARSLLGLVRNLSSAAPVQGRLRLTEREQDVLRGLVGGLTYKEVAEDLGVSIDTVRTHVRGLYKRLQVHSVAAAVARAIRDGLV
jgi:two-component system nitrate/nitrite response regulator NarL